MSPDDKPFECVGERRESAAAISMLARLPEWRDSAVVATLAPRAEELVGEADVTDVLAPARGPAFPVPAVAAAVDEAFGRNVTLDELAARRVAVWGMGQEGRGVVRLLAGRGVPVVLVDDRPDGGGTGGQRARRPDAGDRARRASA